MSFVNTKIFYFLVVSLLFSFLPAAAQETTSLITITTDKASYVEGETIVISGEVSTVIVNEPLTMQIFFQGNLLDVAQLDVAQDGSFTHTVIAEGPLWRNDGEYIVRSHYGGEFSEANFDFSTKKDKPTTGDIFEVDAGSSGTFDVEYTIKGGIIENIVVEPKIFGLVITINSTDDGTLSLNLPRESIDAKTQDGDDEKFIILIDGVEVIPKETKENNARILTIVFEEGDKEIRIIGTQVIPEFGTIMTLVLLVGISTVIMISKNKFQIRI